MANQLAYTILELIPENRTTENAFKSEHNKGRLALVDPGGKNPVCYGIRLSFYVPPRSKTKGFVIGTAGDSDIRLKSNDLYGFHFTIKFNLSSGLLLIENRSAPRLVVGKRELRKQGASCVIQQDMKIRCGDFSFVASAPHRGQYQKKYAESLGKYLRTILHAQGASGVALTTPHAAPIEHPKTFGKYLEIKDIINRTTTKTCVLADVEWGGLYVGKKYRTPSVSKEIQEEINILGNANHKNIVHFVEALFNVDSSIYVITEYLSHGSLEKYEFTQAESVEVLHQCLDGLAYLHNHGVMHRNIKPETILMKSLKPLQVKISGFSLAKQGSRGFSQVGSTVYIAPEMWHNSTYTNVVDVWALGITALTLFNAAPRRDPHFARGATKDNCYRFLNVMRTAYRGKNLHRAVVTLLDTMLDEDPETRMSAKKCLDLTRQVRSAIKKPAAGAAKPQAHRHGHVHVHPAKIKVQLPKFPKNPKLFIAQDPNVLFRGL